MTYDKSQSIDAFITAAAAKQPTPGGGSVAALAGALAASMGEMVLNYSVGKKDLAAYQSDIHTGLTKLHSARQVLLEFMVEDQLAFQEFTAAKKASPADAKAVEEALMRCILIPQSMGGTALAILRICDELVEKSNKYLLSDLAVAAELAMATVRSAGYNVRVNMSELKDPAMQQSALNEMSRQLTDATAIIQRLIPRIWARVEA